MFYEKRQIKRCKIFVMYVSKGKVCPKRKSGKFSTLDWACKDNTYVTKNGLSKKFKANLLFVSIKKIA